MRTLLQDVQFAVRVLGRQSGAVIAAIVCLALGIGATTTIFSVADALLVRALPYPAGDRLMFVGSSRAGDHHSGSTSYLDYLDWLDRQRSFTSLAAVGEVDFTVQRAEAERVRGALVSASLFRTLGVSAELGRLFLPNEDRAGGPPVILVSHDFAERQFGSARQAIGSTVIVDGNRRDIVGVIPDHWRYPSRAELWVPLGRDPLEGRDKRGQRNLAVLGALAPGVTIEAARADMRRIAAELAREYPDDDRAYSTTVDPFRDRVVGDASHSLAALTVAALLMLGVACANVAALQLSRATARTREIAIRAAIGATRSRLVRQLLTESVLLAIVGAAAGCGFAAWSVDFVSHAVIGARPAWMTFDIDGAALLFSLTAGAFAGILFGIAPALMLSGLRPAFTLRDGHVVAGRQGLQRALVAVEIMFGVALSTGAALAIQSIRHVEQIPLGFDPAGVLSVRVTMDANRYDGARRARLVEGIEDRLRLLPDVASVGAASLTPVDGCCSQFAARIEGDASEHDSRAKRMITGTIVTPGYFRTMHIALLAGREFVASDRKDAPLVTIVSETFAHRYWPHGDVLGKHVDTGLGDAEVVGIVPDIKQTSLLDTPEPQFYRPYAQDPWTYVTLVARARNSDAASLAPAVRKAIAEVDHALPAYNARTMNAVVRSARESSLVLGELLTGFAVMALLLSAAGVYAVMSFFVSQRRRELGLRMALGAERPHVMRLVLSQSAATSLVGLAAGLALALVFAQWLSRILYDVTPTQPALLMLVSVVLLIVVMLATFAPARRATNADPMAALRAE